MGNALLHVYSSYVYLRCLFADRRVAALLQFFFSLGGLYNAVAVLVSTTHKVEVDFAQPTPLFGAYLCRRVGCRKHDN